MACAAALAWTLPAPAGATPPEPEPFGTNDLGGFRDVLPPGTNGRANALELGAFLAAGARPRHNDDQLRLYSDLLYASPGVTQQRLAELFKDATFGVRPGDVERRYSPRDDVTIVRDRGFGVPHVDGRTRDGAMFGIGYATAEDRLFFMDIFRHLGRGQLSSFAGGDPANRGFDHLLWSTAPYREEDLQRQIDQRAALPQFEADARRLRVDLAEYVAGVNAYIGEARLDPTKMPGEYAAIGQPLGPDDWKGTDVVATSAVIGAIFGTAGGRELDAALVLEDAKRRFGRRRGPRVWRDFRSAEDPEAPTTVHGRRFSYGARPRRIARGSRALPDRGSVRKLDVVASSTAPRPTAAARATGLLAFPRTSSNALLVSARESRSGRPLAVFGPQTAYFAPQDLMEQEIHAPGMQAHGVAFPGANLYVSIGHGPDYSWSATSAFQDTADTFAVDLCDPGGGRPTTGSMHYRFRGACLPIEVLERRNSWRPTVADDTPAGSEVMRAERTKLGLVVGRATIRGRPVAYTKLRTTYFHESDAGLGISFFNQPDRIRSARDFQRAAYLIPFTFNWFYVDDRQIAYLNSGANPVRAKGTDPNLPIRGTRRFEWRNFDPEALVPAYTPMAQHAQVRDQAFITSWNNKQARGTRASDSNWGFGSTYRSKPLDDRVRRGIRGPRKMSLTELADAAEDSATVDLRADAVLPLALRVLETRGERRAATGHRRRRTVRDPGLRRAIGLLRAWTRSGSHRIDRDRDGSYEQSEAIRLLDAWWPRWITAEFEPSLGSPLFHRVQGLVKLDNHPNNEGQHLGSAWQDGWYGAASKDLRTILRRPVRGRYSRIYCGRGRFGRCRRALERSLRDAIGVPAERLYGGDAVCREAGRDGDQDCFDSIFFRPLGGITQPLIPWQNRPTYQQAVEVRGHRPR